MRSSGIGRQGLDLEGLVDLATLLAFSSGPSEDRTPPCPLLGPKDAKGAGPLCSTGDLYQCPWKE